MSLESLFVGSLTPQERDGLRRDVAELRISALQYLLARVSEDGERKKLGDAWQRLDRFARHLLALGDAHPGRLSSIIDHWATTFFLSRLSYGATGNHAWSQRLLDNLDSVLINDALRHGPVADGVVYETETRPGGGCYALLEDALLRLPGAVGGRFRFTFSGARVTVSRPGGEEVAVAAVPLADGAPLRINEIPRVEGWNLPLVRDIQSLGAEESLPEQTEEVRNPPLEESLAGAHRLLARHWPEVLEWVDALVPVFVDMGTPPNPRSQRSTSFGPGSPICLSSAANELLVAEAIVHELQHHRLLLFTRSEDFPVFGDKTRRFVSPWRPDVRPLRGLYLAVHAFLAVNELRLRLWADQPLETEERQKLLKTHCMNLYGFRTILEHERPSLAGRRVLQSYGATLAGQHDRLRELVDPDDYERVERFFDHHVSAVQRQPESVVNSGARYRAWEETASMARGVPVRGVAS